MLNVGLTGGIASGKSTVAKMFVEKGAYLIDFDDLAHFVEEPDRPAWKAIVDCFGSDILNEDRTINRVELGLIVFADHEKLSLLNSIVHPAVFEEWKRRIEDIYDRDPCAIVISDVPLLIEVGVQHLVDVVVLVYVSPEEQIQRLMTRNTCSRQEAASRLEAQMPIDEKVPYADIVIENRGFQEMTKRVVDDVWKDLIQRERKHRLNS
jgi:dephospho-CoA kinase